MRRLPERQRASAKPCSGESFQTITTILAGLGFKHAKSGESCQGWSEPTEYPNRGV